MNAKYARGANEPANVWLKRIYDLGSASAAEKGRWKEIDEELLSTLLDYMGALLTEAKEIPIGSPLTVAESDLADMRHKIEQLRDEIKKSRWPMVSRKTVCTYLFLLTMHRVQVRVV